MRYFQKGKVLRVAKLDPSRQKFLVLYPSNNREIFYGEAFQKIDDNSARIEILRSDVSDKIWLRLLDGEEIETITNDYESLGLNTYYFAKKGTDFNEFRTRCFEIAPDTDEDEMLAQMEKTRTGSLEALAR